VILDGNRSGRVNSRAWNLCSDGTNRYGFNAQVSANRVAFTYLASIYAVCGTGLEWIGDFATIHHSTFLGNGDHYTSNLFADGLTLLQSDYALVQYNHFVDGSDIGFIVGGAISANIQYNTIIQSGQASFAAFMMDNFNGTTSGDFTGALIANNTITCSPWSQCTYGVNIGPHAWYDSPNIFGGTFTHNTVSGGYTALNVFGGGTASAPITITSSAVSTGSGYSTFNVCADSVVNTNMTIQTQYCPWGIH
jgi:hypothetical protein